MRRYPLPMVIEMLTFRLLPGADERAFVDADARAQTEFVYQRPGLVRRTTARGPDGEWAIVVFWNSEHDANAAIEASGGDASWLALMALVDEATIERKLFATLD